MSNRKVFCPELRLYNVQRRVEVAEKEDKIKNTNEDKDIRVRYLSPE